MASLRERNRRLTMEHIQDVAFGLFEEKGYREVTITEITHAAEVAPSTFYRLFQTKEGLFTALPTEDHLDLGTVRRNHLAEDILTLIAGNEWRGLKWVIEEPDVRCAVLATLATFSSEYGGPVLVMFWRVLPWVVPMIAVADLMTIKSSTRPAA